MSIMFNITISILFIPKTCRDETSIVHHLKFNSKLLTILKANHKGRIIFAYFGLTFYQTLCK